MSIRLIWLFLCVSLVHSTLQGAPQSIVSVDGSLTEIVYALQQQHRLVAVDSTSTYPAQARELPQIGYKRNISAEGVLSLAPQVLIATRDSGPDIILKQIAAAGVKIERYSAQPGLAVVREKIQGLAKLLEVEAAGEALWAQVATDVEHARAHLSEVKEPVKVMFVLSTAGGSVLASGVDTMADAIIGLAGGVNAISAFAGYKPISVEAIVSAAPDIILMMDRAGDHSGGEDLLATAGFNLTPAGINKRLVKMDGMLMLGFGPRIGEAIKRLVVNFYPQLELANVQ